MSAAKATRKSDTHWNDAVPPKSKDISREALTAYKTAKLYSCFVKARDGIKLAVDVMLPRANPGNAPLSCVLFQARYTRGVHLRFPFRLLTDGRPYDFINIAFKAELLLAGYAVISMDFRGTGASFGQWKLPWGPTERQDSLAVLDWMTGQPWCNGKVVLCGQSYDATAALFTASLQHSAVRGCVALYPFWDLYNDIAVPGGIAMKSFSEAWGQFCKGMDANDYSLLQSPAKQFLTMVSKGCNPVVCYDGARLTARSFADMKKSARLLVSSITHPTRLLTFGSSSSAMLAGPKRSIQQAPRVPHAAAAAAPSTPAPEPDAADLEPPQQQSGQLLAGSNAQRNPAIKAPTYAVQPHATESHTQLPAASDIQNPQASQQPMLLQSQQAPGSRQQPAGTAAEHQQAPVSNGIFDAQASQSSGLPASGQHTLSLGNTDGLTRQLSLDTAKDQHVYRSWSRSANLVQLQGMGPVVNAQTIPARGANAEGVSAAHLHISVRRHYKEKGKPWPVEVKAKRLLEAAVSEHNTWDSAAAMKTIRFSDQKASRTNATTADVSLCSVGEELQEAAIPLQLVSGWLDSTAAATINLYHHCGQAPGLAAGSELVIGPWSHGGLVDQSVAEDSSFDQPKHSMAFINRCCDRTPSHAHASQPAQASHQAHPQQQSSSIVAGAPQLNEGSAGFVQARTADPQTSSRGQCTSNKEAEDAALPSVHFFMMGAEERGWKASHSWPPSNASSPPLKLFLNKAPAPVSKPSRSWFRSGRKSAKVANREDSASQAMQTQQMPDEENVSNQLNPTPLSAINGQSQVTQIVTSSTKKHPQLGQLTKAAAQQNCRFRHDVDLQKHPKGLSRYDAISKITKSMHYDNLGKCGHLVFTGQPLSQATQVVGAAGVEVWVESMGPDTDVFAYLEDIDVMGNIRYVTEGMFRASHRKEYGTPPPNHPRERATLPGEPFHSFAKADAQEIPQGTAVLCRFQMIPTAYTFAKGHSMRIAISGADAKHFYTDHLNTKTLWIHTGPGRQSTVSFYIVNSQDA